MSSYVASMSWSIFERLISILFFQLSDVEGGFTAFPNMGVATRPVKGSFAYWYNLRENGERDLRSLHGACPTIYGIKWGEPRVISYLSLVCYVNKPKLPHRSLIFFFCARILVS